MVYGLETGADRVLTMDADFSHRPRYLPDLVAEMANHDIMIGSRYVDGGGTRHWGLHRQILSRTANRVTHLLLKLPAKDATAGLRCYARRVLETVDPRGIRSEGYAYQEEMLFRCHRAGFTIGETPIIFEERRAGRSKINRAEVFKAMATLVRLRFSRESGVRSEATIGRDGPHDVTPR